MKVEIPNSILVTLSGQTSRGVKGIEVREADGHLIFTLTDGKEMDMGSVMGPQGPKGEPGATGPQGHAGHTPVKGTDYFTAADKSEIAQAAAEMVSVPSASSTTPKEPGTASAGTSAAYARGDHVHPSDNTKQDTLTGAEGQAVVFDANGKAIAADTTETELMDIPAGVLKGTSSGISAAEAGKDYMAPVAVTAADNGKFLRVVNGAWAVASVADASGVSF